MTSVHKEGGAGFTLIHSGASLNLEHDQKESASQHPTFACNCVCLK